MIGVGNGDPTSHESDIGATRKAFAGYCMAIVQSEKSGGTITIEASSPGLTAATATVASKPVTLRPQVAPWERPVPTGPGITGLWRPAAVAAAPTDNPMALAGGNAEIVFTFRHEGTTLAGSVESAGGGGFGGGGAANGPIEDGRIDGAKISFRVGTTTFTGQVAGDRIELQRSAPARRGGAAAPGAPADAGPRPAVGPPPQGSDPSFGAGRGAQAPAPLVLRRVTR